MLLYIVRHAWAKERNAERWPDDGLRPLTKEGIKRFRRVARLLVARSVDPQVIATSPLIRCRQTADILAKYAPQSPKIVELDALAPGSKLGPLCEWTKGRRRSRVAWVGHAPDVDRLASALLGVSADALRFTKGSVAAIDFEGDVGPGKGTLQWFVTAKMLGA